jgi:quercetin dioxygenase-like cupin family protein
MTNTQIGEAIEISSISQKEVIKGFKARFIHTQDSTLAFWEIEKGAVLPMHSHMHEQTTQVLEGQFELTVGEHTQIYENGLLVVIPSHVVHGGVAITDCKIFDIFCPVREDYKAL